MNWTVLKNGPEWRQEAVQVCTPYVASGRKIIETSLVHSFYVYIPWGEVSDVAEVTVGLR